MDFFNWEMLGTYAGAVFAVAVLTQITKNIPGIKALPTQVWSYILGYAVLIAAMVFTESFAPSGVVLALFNAALVSLSANGGYAAVERIKAGLEYAPEDDEPEETEGTEAE